MIYVQKRPGVDKHALCVYHKFANESDEVDAIHTSVYLPPLTDLETQLTSKQYVYNASRRIHPEQWFTGNYDINYFDRSQKETRIFASDYDNPTETYPDPGVRSSMWWFMNSSEFTP